jgi:hypothetical protein
MNRKLLKIARKLAKIEREYEQIPNAQVLKKKRMEKKYRSLYLKYEQQGGQIGKI